MTVKNDYFEVPSQYFHPVNSQNHLTLNSLTSICLLSPFFHHFACTLDEPETRRLSADPLNALSSLVRLFVSFGLETDRFVNYLLFIHLVIGFHISKNTLIHLLMHRHYCCLLLTCLYYQTKINEKKHEQKGHRASAADELFFHIVYNVKVTTDLRKIKVKMLREKGGEEQD